MDTSLLEHELKDQAYKNEWDEIVKNKMDFAKKYHTGKWSMHGVLSHFKKCFHITPIALKQGQTEKAKELREFALFILANYAKNDLETIAIEFNTTSKELETIKGNRSLESKYKKEIELYFKDLIGPALREKHMNIAFIDSALQAIDLEDKKLIERLV